MKKIMTGAIAALILAGGAVATATPAAADGWHGRGGGYGYRGGGGAGPAIFAGVAGLALGAALAGDHPRRYAYYDAPPPYDDYYGSGYAYDRPYATCYGARRTWDPYIGRYIVHRVPYAC